MNKQYTKIQHLYIILNKILKERYQDIKEINVSNFEDDIYVNIKTNYKTKDVINEIKYEVFKISQFTSIPVTHTAVYPYNVLF